MFKGKKESEYCWYCKGVGSQVFCSKSKCGLLGFHLQCAAENEEKIQFSGENNTVSVDKCQQCLKLKKSCEIHTKSKSRHGKVNQLDNVKMNQILAKVLDVTAATVPPPGIMLISRGKNPFIQDSGSIDFAEIGMKLEKNRYKYPEELLFDLRRIENAIMIDRGITEETVKIKYFIRQVELNCMIIDFCPNCAYNDHFGLHSRATLCPKLHRPVLFDRTEGIKGYQNDEIRAELLKLPRLLPGKVVGLNPQNWKRILFFGRGKQMCFEVPKNNVFHLNESGIRCSFNEMVSMAAGDSKKSLDKAIQEAKQYVMNLWHEVGDDWKFTDGRMIVESNHKLFIENKTKPTTLTTGLEPAFDEMHI